jgi:V/A-type H+-transporting ATPase subunit E
MKSLETGKDKIKKICDAIRLETLEPVKQEAKELIENAKLEAGEILETAEKKAKQMIAQAEEEIQSKMQQFQASMNLACRQGIESIKQKIEKELFSKALFEIVQDEMIKPDLIGKIIETFLRSLESKGIEEDFEASIPKEISPRDINRLLGQKVLERLRGKSVKIDDIKGGVKLSMPDRQISIDLSEEAVRELVASYIRKDFRELVFSI